MSKVTPDSLLSSSDFDSGLDGWAVYNAGTVANDNGRLKFSGSVPWSTVKKPLTLETGKQYRVRFTIDMGNCHNLSVPVYKSDITSYVMLDGIGSLTGSGTYEGTFTATSNSMLLLFEMVPTGNPPPDSTGYYWLDDVTVEEIKPGGGGTSGNEGGYRYSVNGQERTPEIAANTTTAQYWEYDSRIGRRWNLDSKQVVGLSRFSVFKNSPLFYKDILGDTTYRFDKEGKYSGMGDLDKKGIIGSVGEYESFKDSKGKEFKTWASSRTFSFNDPNVDNKQLNSLKEGDKALQVVEDGNINDIMNQAEIKPMNIYSRWAYANKQSDGGKMDFGVMYLNGHPGGGNNDLAGGFYIFGSENKAYNAMDAGNWLWGQAMKRLGFSYSTAKFASEANEWFKDSEGDQRAIRFGYFYSTKIKNAIPFKVTNGIPNTTIK